MPVCWCEVARLPPVISTERPTRINSESSSRNRYLPVLTARRDRAGFEYFMYFRDRSYLLHELAKRYFTVSHERHPRLEASYAGSSESSPTLPLAPGAAREGRR